MPERSTPSGDGKGKKRAFLLRLDPAVHDALRRWAADEMRSLNGHIEYLLREAVRRKRGGKAEEERS